MNERLTAIFRYTERFSAYPTGIIDYSRLARSWPLPKRGSCQVGIARANYRYGIRSAPLPQTPQHRLDGIGVPAAAGGGYPSAMQALAGHLPWLE